MKKELPLINKKYLLEKFPGKGGWTYAAIPEIPPDRKSYFGWVRVRGWIDDFEIRCYHLMPMGNGMLFLPVKAAIRKKIGKQEGDMVHVILYPDNSPVEIPEELLLCLQEDKDAYEAFIKLTDTEKKSTVEWIYSAKNEDTRIDRIARTMNSLTGQNLQ